MALEFDWQWGVEGTYHQRMMDMATLGVEVYERRGYSVLDARCYKHGADHSLSHPYILLRIIGTKDEIAALDEGTVMDLVRCRYGFGI